MAKNLEHSGNQQLFLIHPFQQRRSEQIDGVERHARAVIGAAAGAGAFTPEKSLAVGK